MRKQKHSRSFQGFHVEAHGAGLLDKAKVMASMALAIAFMGVEVLAQPAAVYVDTNYRGLSGQVTFPAHGGSGSHTVGYDAFSSVQSGLDHVASSGLVRVAAGTYVEDLAITNPVTLLGPNAGTPGNAVGRGPEAMLLPQTADPDSGQIIYLGASQVTIDGFLFDSRNPAFQPNQGYDACGTKVFSSAAVQNTDFWTTDFAQVDHVTIQNNVIRNISYDGIYLEVELGSVNGFNYICNNRFETMWEGLLTYGVQGVISNNTFVSVNRGLSVHGITVPARAGFIPCVVSNVFTIAEWWPLSAELDRVYSMGVWVNYRRGEAALLEVIGNVVNTPLPSPSGKTVRGFYTLDVDGGGKVNLVNNTVNGAGNCHVGIVAASCWSNNAVQVRGGTLDQILQTGVLVDTTDPVFGGGDALLSISNLQIRMTPGGLGVAAVQEPATPTNHAQVNILGGTAIHGGAWGVYVTGAGAAASIANGDGLITGNAVGVRVNGGRALLEHTVLTNNAQAGIYVENNGLVDAGDCAGGNMTGLGTGTGSNGSSAGFNDLSGYVFDGAAPFAVYNAATAMVLAQENLFGAGPGDRLSDAVKGAVTCSQASAQISPPPPLNVQCMGEVPAGATTLADFLAMGGAASANPAASVSYLDTLVRPGSHIQLVTRTYSVTDLCGHSVSCDQVITVHDQTAPTLICPENLVQPAEPGQNYATVNFIVTATDNCDATPAIQCAPPPGRFAVGTNTVLATATDFSGNATTRSFTVTVVLPPMITNQPANLVVALGAPALFQVGAAGAPPVTYQWERNGTDIPTATTHNFTIPAVQTGDIGDYRVVVSNPYGTATSRTASLQVIFPPTQLRIVAAEAGTATLTMSGADGYRYAIFSSSNFLQDSWVGLLTNTAPYSFRYTNNAERQFFRGGFVP
jgi:hypothetical protein